MAATGKSGKRRDRRVSQVRARSKALFGNAYMLEVCAAIARRDGRVNLTTLVSQADVSASVYSGPLRRLAEVGLLIEDPKPEDDRRERWYLPTKSRLWKAARDLAE